MGIFLGTFLTISASNTAEIINNGKDLISDLMPLLVIIIGVGIALWILEAFLHR